jgi:hypothetical protein
MAYLPARLNGEKPRQTEAGALPRTRRGSCRRRHR